MSIIDKALEANRNSLRTCCASVSGSLRALAFANIEKAANHYNVNLAETSWHDLGIHPQKNRKEAAAKGAVTRERGREKK
jgi:hypothetical protein